MSINSQWIKKLWYIYTMEYYSATNVNGLESILVRYMKLEPVTQSEVRKRKKIYHVLTHIYGSRKKVLMNLSAGKQ